MSTYFRLFLGFSAMLILAILPFPKLLQTISPLGVVLFTLYVQCFLPSYFSVLVISFIGLCLDALLSTCMGQHAFALLLTTWVASSKARRFAFFSPGQQILLIGIFALIYQLALLFLEAFQGFYPPLFASIGCVITSMLLWPWLKWTADELFDHHAPHQPFYRK